MSEELRDKEADSAQELTNFVKGILNQMNERFTVMTDNIVNRIEEMTDRINDLEQTVAQLVEETNSIDQKASNHSQYYKQHESSSAITQNNKNASNMNNSNSMADN